MNYFKFGAELARAVPPGCNDTKTLHLAMIEMGDPGAKVDKTTRVNNSWGWPNKVGINYGSISFGQLSGYIVFWTVPTWGAK